jgi:hypothetical protein
VADQFELAFGNITALISLAQLLCTLNVALNIPMPIASRDEE